MSSSKPSLRVPAEWESQSCIWLSWPHNLQTWQERFDAIPAFYARWVATIAESTPVRVLASDVVAEQCESMIGKISNVDIIDIPTGIFRGFENIGTDYGMIMAILGGDDAGGGVIWAPQVIEDAADHGLVLAETGRLYDTKKGQSLPEGVKPMPRLSEDELQAYPEPNTAEVVPGYVARYWDLHALADRKPASVIGEFGKLRDKPGFEVDFITCSSATGKMHQHERPSVLMPMRGHWRLSWKDGSSVLNPGDTASVPEKVPHSITPSMTGEASLYHVVATEDPAGATWQG